MCTKGNSNDIAARLICQELKYSDGFFRTPQSKDTVQRGYCSEFKGTDHCGPIGMPIIFKDIKCEGKEKSFWDCYRDSASEDHTCSHQDDIIIECSNIDFEVSAKIEKDTVRIVNKEGVSDSNEGRLELFNVNIFLFFIIKIFLIIFFFFLLKREKLGAQFAIINFHKPVQLLLVSKWGTMVEIYMMNFKKLELAKISKVKIIAQLEPLLLKI